MHRESIVSSFHLAVSPEEPRGKLLVLWLQAWAWEVAYKVSQTKADSSTNKQPRGDRHGVRKIPYMTRLSVSAVLRLGM